MEWRKLQQDSTPNGYVDLTEVKLISTVDTDGSGGGITVDGKHNCFMIIDNNNVEHIFCTETVKNFEKWLPYLELYNHKFSEGSKGEIQYAMRNIDYHKDESDNHSKACFDDIPVPDSSNTENTILSHDQNTELPSSEVDERT